MKLVARAPEFGVNEQIVADYLGNLKINKDMVVFGSELKLRGEHPVGSWKCLRVLTEKTALWIRVL